MGLPVGRSSLIGNGEDHLKFGMGGGAGVHCQYVGESGGDVTQRTAFAWVAYTLVWAS